ncbi:MAG: FAD-dependent oxidoreductase [Desulfurococcaceae archaeon]
MVEEYDVIVIGGGIAGFSAALYLARQGLRTLVISMDIGGQLSYASTIENYPGLDPLPGQELVMKVQRQALSYGAQLLVDEVLAIEWLGDRFRVRTRRGGEFASVAVIVASGKSPRKLGLPHEDRFLGRGLSYCVVCDAPLFKGKRVALASFGEKGAEELARLAAIASVVHYVTPSKDDLGLREAARHGNVVAHPGCKVVGIEGGDRLQGIRISCSDGTKVLEVDGLFVEMGFESRLDFVKDLVEINELGEIIVDDFCRTRTPGLFAAGDVTSKAVFKQAVIAAAEGAKAALSAINYVLRRRGVARTVKADWEKKTTREPVSKRFKL